MAGGSVRIKQEHEAPACVPRSAPLELNLDDFDEDEVIAFEDEQQPGPGPSGVSQPQGCRLDPLLSSAGGPTLGLHSTAKQLLSGADGNHFAGVENGPAGNPAALELAIKREQVEAFAAGPVPGTIAGAWSGHGGAGRLIDLTEFDEEDAVSFGSDADSDVVDIQALDDYEEEVAIDVGDVALEAEAPPGGPESAARPSEPEPLQVLPAPPGSFADAPAASLAKPVDPPGRDAASHEAEPPSASLREHFARETAQAIGKAKGLGNSGLQSVKREGKASKQGSAVGPSQLASSAAKTPSSSQSAAADKPRSSSDRAGRSSISSATMGDSDSRLVSGGGSGAKRAGPGDPRTQERARAAVASTPQGKAEDSKQPATAARGPTDGATAAHRAARPPAKHPATGASAVHEPAATPFQQAAAKLRPGRREPSPAAAQRAQQARPQETGGSLAAAADVVRPRFSGVGDSGSGKVSRELLEQARAKLRAAAEHRDSTQSSAEREAPSVEERVRQFREERGLGGAGGGGGGSRHASPARVGAGGAGGQRVGGEPTGEGSGDPVLLPSRLGRGGKLEERAGGAGSGGITVADGGGSDSAAEDPGAVAVAGGGLDGAPRAARPKEDEFEEETVVEFEVPAEAAEGKGKPFGALAECRFEAGRCKGQAAGRWGSGCWGVAYSHSRRCHLPSWPRRCEPW